MLYEVITVALRWLLELFDLPRESGGSFVTGATVANFAALAAARHSVYVKAGWDIEGQGLIGAPPVVIAIPQAPPASNGEGGNISVASDFSPAANTVWQMVPGVITSYSIHYTKLYDEALLLLAHRLFFQSLCDCRKVRD